GSTLTTWYNTDYSPAVAVTTYTDERTKGRKQALEVLDKDPQQPRPAPLTQLSSADIAEVCTSLMDEIPDTVGEDYERFAVTEEKTAAWGAEGREPIVIRCGVAPPANYEEGAEVQQLNEITWFQYSQLCVGTTERLWVVLG